MRRILPLLLASAAAVGCGGESDSTATVASTATSGAEASPTRSAQVLPADEEAPVREPADPYDATHQGTLTDEDPRVPDDDSPYDEYPVLVEAGWTVTADMRSAEFDTYLWLIDPDGVSVVQDDDGGESTNSYFVYTGTRSGAYTVRANSYDATGRGAYTLRVTASTEPLAGPVDDGPPSSEIGP